MYIDKMKNTILFGDFSVGKSTIIDNYISYLKKNNISYGGYRTFSIEENGDYNIYIIPASSNYQLDKNNTMHKLVSCDYVLNESNKIGNRKSKIFNKEVFNSVGLNIFINDIQNKNIVVIDEIGFLELDNNQFMDAIYKCFNDKNKKVVAVVRKTCNNLFDKIRDNENTIIIEVTKNNREEILNKYLL